jgi:hypothetical protein
MTDADTVETPLGWTKKKKILKLLFNVLSLHPTWVVDPDAALE